eukprot:CAMPEP_0183300866 /NCGR_PEP_ID=MMETSP0160_2-20130417/7150_1 /TAXON_ID=2839 ORGANISM="Odontella Sinensis, Strain Grunow 1884" /NCGR_SAMPLE_ID=MMETSP0160_2 /ASSEMBLY_ACC=CAM_ASM_000250 /LENGTH=98 /DNA_ID=CAMNT_0025463359 /DNA_START=128 /DNA_END=424 /DNA_ORIENTATION=+
MSSQEKPQLSHGPEDRNLKIRREMLQHIAMLLSKRTENLNMVMPRAKLLVLSKKLEAELYFSSPSLEVYSDVTTVADRINVIIEGFAADHEVGTGEGV